MKTTYIIRDKIKQFRSNFQEDFIWEEAEIWLESEIKNIIKNILPKKISDKTTAKEIQNNPKRLDDVAKQNIRAKNFGWNSCIKKIQKDLII